jgi:hypothetical protein
MRYRRAYEQPWGGSRLRYKHATYCQFIKSGLVPVYLFIYGNPFDFVVPFFSVSCLHVIFD